MINMVMIMRNFTKKAIKCAKAAAATAAFAFCMTKTAEVSQAVSGAVERCIEVVIPSLFAMMIVSGLLVRSGITGAVPRFIGTISEKLLGMEGFMLPVFTFGMFAGYPVGAKMICTEVQCGRLDKNRAALLCGLCYGAGPAFIFGIRSRASMRFAAVFETRITAPAVGEEYSRPEIQPKINAGPAP